MLKIEPLPMAEAQAFWSDKVPMGYGEFAQLSDAAKVKAFAVSGIARGDELDTVFTALQKAIDQGTTLEDFKRDCAAIFARRGWTGKRAWRMDNIFRTNIQTAYNVGQYKQLMEDRAVFPIWQYSAINDARTRPTHRAMDGRAWPADHPMWNIWFPPNGYRCRCAVIGLTARQAETRGVEVESGDPTHTLVEPIDSGTGNRMPARQLLPDPGFNSNPGKVYWEGAGEVYAGKIERWAEPLRQPALRDLIGGPVFAHWYAHPQGAFPVGLLDAASAELIGARTQVVRLSAETVSKQMHAHPELAAGEYVAVQAAIGRGAMIQDTPQSLVYILEEAPGYVSVVKATVSGEAVYLVSFRRLSGDAAKRDAEVQRLLRKAGK